ncbi:MAG: hypothetical protein R2734_09850 [Nocardioides sp.]
MSGSSPRGSTTGGDATRLRGGDRGGGLRGRSRAGSTTSSPGGARRGRGAARGHRGPRPDLRAALHLGGPASSAASASSDLLATEDGLWVGSDTEWIQGERRARIAFLPLEGGEVLPTLTAPALPGQVGQLGRHGG